ncbi:septum formation initiator family protein [Leucobacter luti]|uniref:Cell division protein FtsB n=1 Tax=Leucobacter luti TaxID=340320 RepID=A0A4V3CYJ7_9MICO|nr:septum formation initiator family protein [Leucobacter luti]MCW2287227.1 cell division protein FtsB [Leucobacter luti]QYM76694.1 septum formation initiator family protein [Leucobacter luti]TCK41453.1 cell division protein FtsB [Leucobacter luti]TDP94428.1 cell division protein FtsB [Leucobacter luti]
MKRWAEDLGAWATSLRFSGFTVLVVVLVMAGAVIVSPSLSTYVQQRREISELRESVRLHQEAVNEIDAERAKWKDPVYVRSQARDRLFYVLPGETQLNVIDDIVMPVESDEETSAELSRMNDNWARGLASSFLSAGTMEADPATADAAASGSDADASDPTPTTDPASEGTEETTE